MNNIPLKNDYCVFTVCNLAYLPKALVLAESTLKFTGEKLKIFIFDKKIDKNLNNLFADIYWIEELNIPDFSKLAFRYDIIELSTSLKPYITLALFKTYSKVIFLDPDICVYSSLSPILDDLDKASIILTPHHTTPQSDHPDERDTPMMRFGSFNLGFYAVKNNEQGNYFLNWWSKRCFQLCFMDSQFGLSTDQKWVSIAPCFFKDIYISFNLGYNVSAWNSWERKISKNEDGIYVVNNKFPLVFFHFSNFKSSDPGYMDKRSFFEKGIERPDFTELGIEYNSQLEKNSILKIVNYKYSYDYMSGGEYISPTLRRAYDSILEDLPESHNPFDSHGLVGKFAKKNNLYERKNTPYKREGFSSVSNNKNKLKLVYFFMRLLLRIVGPNKFMNLSRLLVLLSSYQRNNGLWKI